jgi:hypothetical protein
MSLSDIDDDYTYIYCIALFIITNIADLVLTYIGLSKGTITEGNPLIAYLISLGWEYAIAYKVGITVMLIALFNYIYKKNEAIAIHIVSIIVGFLYCACFFHVIFTFFS